MRRAWGVIGAAVLAALALSVASSAQSGPGADQIDHKVPRIGPEGVPVIENQQEAYQEANEAFSRIRHRVNGVLWLHAPKANENAWVGFTESPTAYADSVGPLFEPGYPGALRVTQYYIVNFNTKAGMREYAVTFDKERQKYSFLDLEYARSVGAVSFGQFKGLPQESPFNIGKDAQFTPINEQWPKTPPAAVFKHAYDIHGNLRRIVPGSMPRP